MNVTFVQSPCPPPSERGHRANYLHGDNEAIATRILGSQASLCRGLQRLAGWGPRTLQKGVGEGCAGCWRSRVNALGNEGSLWAPDSALGNPPLCPGPKGTEDPSHLPDLATLHLSSQSRPFPAPSMGFYPLARHLVSHRAARQGRAWSLQPLVLSGKHGLMFCELPEAY